MVGGTTPRMRNAEVKCLEVAAKQMGVLHRSQAMAHLSRWQIERRVSREAGETPWVRVLRGVYRVEGSVECWRQRVEALSLWGGPKSVLSHRTAAALHGFDDFKVDPLGKAGPLEITVKPQKRKLKLEGARIYRCKPPPHWDVIVRDDGLCVTSVPRTLMDMSRLVTFTQLRSMMSQALREKKTTLMQLQRFLERTRKRPGIVRFRAVLASITGEGGPTDSQLEELALRVLRQAKMPKPDVQKRQVSKGKRRRIDFIFERQKVIVETDGYAYHSGVEAFEKDRRRRNSLCADGYVVLQWTWRGLQDNPDELINELCAVLYR